MPDLLYEDTSMRTLRVLASHKVHTTEELIKAIESGGLLSQIPRTSKKVIEDIHRVYRKYIPEPPAPVIIPKRKRQKSLISLEHFQAAVQSHETLNALQRNLGITRYALIRLCQTHGQALQQVSVTMRARAMGKLKMQILGAAVDCCTYAELGNKFQATVQCMRDRAEACNARKELKKIFRANTKRKKEAHLQAMRDHLTLACGSAESYWDVSSLTNVPFSSVSKYLAGTDAPRILRENRRDQLRDLFIQTSKRCRTQIEMAKRLGITQANISATSERLGIKDQVLAQLAENRASAFLGHHQSESQAA